MKLIRRQRSDLWNWAPVEQFSTLRDEISRLFDSPFGELTRRTELSNGWAPSLDVYEDKDNLVVKAELPGLKREEINISFHDRTLEISGERRSEQQSKDAETYRTERYFGRFHRTLTLPKPVQSDKATASYNDGILTVTLPKTEDAKPKQIQISAS